MMSNYDFNTLSFNKDRHNQRIAFKKKIDKLIQHKDTKFYCVNEFTEICEYIYNKFVGIDLSDVNIYICDHKILNRMGFGNIGGFFCEEFNLIIIKNRTKTVLSRGKFNKIMSQYQADVEIDDILVHELMHAVSAKMDRNSRRFSHMEEVFVYTNCIDYYKQKGMSENDIVEKNFLPFCVNDVLNNYKLMSSVFDSLVSVVPEKDIIILKSGSHPSFQRKLSNHAEVIINAIVDRSRQLGHSMISHYHKSNGKSITKKKIHDDTFSRFKLLF